MAEKGWLTGLDKQSTREGRTADNVRRKNRGGAPRGGACWKSCAGASQARPGMVSRQPTAYPDEEQRDSTSVTTVPPKWPMTAWGTACGDYFRVTTRKLARPLNTSAFIGTNSRIHLKWNSGFDPSFGVLRRSNLRLAIIRTLSDGRDVTQLGPEVFSGTSISQGAQYLGMDTVNSPSQVGRELMC